MDHRSASGALFGIMLNQFYEGFPPNFTASDGPSRTGQSHVEGAFICAIAIQW